MNQIIFILALSVVFIVGRNTYAQVTTFENNFQAWIDQVGASAILIDFDSIEGSLKTPIAGDEFSSSPGSPFISLISGEGVFVGNPAPGQIPIPPSGSNMLAPASSGSIEGILKISFDEPIKAFGATFVDVEADYNSTGFSTAMGAALPEVSFSGNQGQGVFSFLGFISERAFTEVEIHFATGSNVDGVSLDDLIYSLEILGPVEADSVNLREYSLSLVYPNPSATVASINLTLAGAQHVKVEVFNVLGSRVVLLHDGPLAAKEHIFTFNTGEFSNASSTYKIQVKGEQFTATRRLILVK